MLSLLIAVLLQAAPAASPAIEGPRDNGLPKDDYRLVAWCHGALAGQLELDPVAKTDMEKIEGKAKVAARAKADAELETERRQYLKDYEHALAAAEAASPKMIHAQGVAAEKQGYSLWTATRNKEPIWRMLDWGIWDANDAGCGDAAKRLYNKATLLGVALKNSDDDAKPEAAAAPGETAAPVAEAGTDAKAGTPADAPPAVAAPVGDAPATEAKTPAARKTRKVIARKVAPAKPEASETKAEAVAQPSVAPEPAPVPVAETKVADTGAADFTAPATDAAPPAAPAPAPTKKTRKVAAKTPAAAKKKLSMDSSAEEIRSAIAAGKAETEAAPAPAAPAPTAPAPADPATPGLRGPQ